MATLPDSDLMSLLPLLTVCTLFTRRHNIPQHTFTHLPFFEALGAWEITPKQSDPNIYESPRMFRHGDDIYLVARRDVDGPFDLGYTYLPFDVQKVPTYAQHLQLGPQ